MQAQWKLSRGLGIANLMAIRRLSDLEALGNANSEARALASGCSQTPRLTGAGAVLVHAVLCGGAVTL